VLSVRRLALVLRGQLFVLCTAIVPLVAAAQPAPDTVRACFAGRPLPECKTFWITEVGYYHRAFGGGSIQPVPADFAGRLDLDNHFSWELGRMSNRSARTAVGGTFLVGGGGSGLRFGVKARYRRWLSKRSSLDLSGGALGVVTRSLYSQPSARGYGITGDVALDWKDWAAITVRADAIRGEGRNATAVYTGVRLGSYPAIAATAAIAAYIALLFALLSGEGT
jgi:hypothetical protein